MHRRVAITLAAAGIASTLVGCSFDKPARVRIDKTSEVVIDSGMQRIDVSTVPPGIAVEIPGYGSILTPDTVDLAADTDHELIFRGEGFDERRVFIDSGNNGWSIEGDATPFTNRFTLEPHFIHLDMETGNRVLTAAEQAQITFDTYQRALAIAAQEAEFAKMIAEAITEQERIEIREKLRVERHAAREARRETELAERLAQLAADTEEARAQAEAFRLQVTEEEASARAGADEEAAMRAERIRQDQIARAEAEFRAALEALAVAEAMATGNSVFVGEPVEPLPGNPEHEDEPQTEDDEGVEITGVDPDAQD